MSDKKKLLITASTFPRHEEDTEPRFILDLAQALQVYYDVTVLAPASPEAEMQEVLEGVKVVRYRYFPIRKWETLCYPGAIVPRIKEKKSRIFLVPFLFAGLYLKLRKMLPQFDCVHAHWLIPQGIVQSFFQKPYVVTGHGGDVTSLNIPIVKQLKKRCLNKADYIIVVSKALLEEVNNLGIASKQTAILPMGCRTAEFGRQYFVPNYFGQGDKPVILFVGRLAEKKGTTYLIEAMREIDGMLVIVGDGPLREQLQQQAQGVNREIRFLGAKNHAELKTIYASADVFVAPSVTAKDGDKEGMPVVILEAMASGLPVVASDSSGIGSVVHNGVNGFLTRERDSADIIQKVKVILEDETIRKELMRQSIRTAEQYDYDTIAKKYNQIFRKVLKKRSQNENQFCHSRL